MTNIVDPFWLGVFLTLVALSAAALAGAAFALGFMWARDSVRFRSMGFWR